MIPASLFFIVVMCALLIEANRKLMEINSKRK